MPTTPDRTSEGTGVRISVPLMRRFEFRCDDEPGRIPDGTPIKYEWGMDVYRPDHFSVGVDFSVEVNVGGISGSATYRILFKIDKESPSAEDVETNLRTLASRVAPTTLYPFVREAFSSAAARCGIPFVLPFENVGALFSPAEIELPSPASGDAELGGE
jgi:hypothetical protein